MAESSGSAACQRAQQRCRIGNRAAHRTRRVLTMRDGNDSGAADEADRRLDPDDSVCR